MIVDPVSAESTGEVIVDDVEVEPKDGIEGHVQEKSTDEVIVVRTNEAHRRLGADCIEHGQKLEQEQDVEEGDASV